MTLTQPNREVMGGPEIFVSASQIRWLIETLERILIKNEEEGK